MKRICPVWQLVASRMALGLACPGEAMKWQPELLGSNNMGSDFILGEYSSETKHQERVNRLRNRCTMIIQGC